MKNIKMQNFRIITLPVGDKRPIAKFYRCYLEDVANGVAVERCRGINHEQFRAADRLAANYQRAIACKGGSVVRIESNKAYQVHYGFENQVAALEEHNRIFVKLSRKSQDIIQHFCLNELPLRGFELKQIPQWCKGVGGARLREALDELAEIYQKYSKNKPVK